MGEAVQYTISGGSAMSSDLNHFFRGLGVTIYEGYGLTESTAAVTVNHPGDQVIGTVGRPVGGCSVRIADDGEIMLRGPVIFDRYWRNEEATADTFEGEWFKTGDIGELDETGHLRITGRKKVSHRHRRRQERRTGSDGRPDALPPAGLPGCGGRRWPPLRDRSGHPRPGGPGQVEDRAQCCREPQPQRVGRLQPHPAR